MFQFPERGGESKEMAMRGRTERESGIQKFGQREGGGGGSPDSFVSSLMQTLPAEN